MPRLFIDEDSEDEELQLELSRQTEEIKDSSNKASQELHNETNEAVLANAEEEDALDSKPLYPLIPNENIDEGLKPNLDDIRQVDIQLNLPLAFQQQVVENTLVTEDPLVILGRGIGIISIVVNLLFTLATPTRINGQPKRSFVIILNASPANNLRIEEELQELSWLSGCEEIDREEENAQRPFHVINAESQNSDKRHQLYIAGGIFSITSRILIVDLLSGLVHPNRITGMVVLNAEKLKSYSNESFILEIYRSKNKWGFIKAFSEAPEAFVTKFSPLMRKMKDLRLRNVTLWPRFRVEISQCLNNAVDPKINKVIEIKVSQTNSMSQIQFGLMGCLKKCIAELNRKNPELALETWTIDNVLDTTFVRSIDAVMIPNWHRISYESKQLIKDIRFLKNLLKLLVSGDAVDFYEELQLSIDANKPSISKKYSESPWLMADESQMVISYAKKRIYCDGEYHLEEMPKWEQLVSILEDISYQRSYRDVQGPTLIVCSCATTVSQLSRVLSQADKKDGFRRNMLRKLQIYKERREVSKRLVREVREKEPEIAPELNVSAAFTKQEVLTKRRRTRGAAAVAAVERLKSAGSGEDIESVINEYDANDELDSEGLLEISDSEEAPAIEGDFEEKFPVNNISQKVLTKEIWDQRLTDYQFIDCADQIIIEKFDNIIDDSYLQEIMPSNIIMYEPDLSFIRRVEIHRAIHRELPPNVYFMYYSDSVEEQGHLTSIRKEKEAFTKLIRENSMLAHHFEADEDLSHYKNLADRKVKLNRLRKVTTRVAGGQAALADFTQDVVIVDTREFNAALPGLLYRYGVRVVPCMLTVGDYIITPDICIERKSIADLIGSIQNHRLVAQCKKMMRNYKYPTLLIEFEEGQSFSLEPFSERRSYRSKELSTVHPISNKLSQDEIQMELATLAMKFPGLKVIWSSSPLQTVNVILELKIGRDQPDPSQSITVGKKSKQKKYEKNEAASPIDQQDYSSILRIPGISKVDYFNIRKKVKSFQRLKAMSLQELSDLFGDEDLVEKLHRFLLAEREDEEDSNIE
ncbi:probable DNA repair protein RAD1 [Zygosaccharomyces bailii ISA1307]|nr:probable DNA repair protein RAD1 [Zygosaccharomyces bailii ISA1307]